MECIKHIRKSFDKKFVKKWSSTWKYHGRANVENSTQPLPPPLNWGYGKGTSIILQAKQN